MLSKATDLYLESLQIKKGSIPLRNQPFYLWTSLGLNQGPPDYESQIIDFQ